MFNERNLKSKRDNENVVDVLMRSDDAYKVKNIHWTCKDEIYRKGELVEVIEGHNLVVSSCSKLLAGLMGGKITNGIQYWAVGSGNTAWDAQWGTATPPTPADSDIKLLAEITRKAITAANIKFVDASGNELADSTFSNRIKITVAFAENEGNGDWREFGLFGGNATATKDSGILIDRKLHKILSKTTDISVTRSIILEF